MITTMPKAPTMPTTTMYLPRWLLVAALVSYSYGQKATDISMSSDKTKTDQNDGGNPRLFSPRMDYDEWTPLGRGDPLKNNPTFDYVPPVLDRVHYWLDSQTTEASTKRDILVLGVTAKKTSPKIPEQFLKFADAPKFTKPEQDPSLYRSDFTGSTGAEPPKVVRTTNFRRVPIAYNNPNKVQSAPSGYYAGSSAYNAQNTVPHSLILPPATSLSASPLTDGFKGGPFAAPKDKFMGYAGATEALVKTQPAERPYDQRIVPVPPSPLRPGTLGATTEPQVQNSVRPGNKLRASQPSSLIGYHATKNPHGSAATPSPASRPVVRVSTSAPSVSFEKSNLIYQSTQTISGGWLVSNHDPPTLPSAPAAASTSTHHSRDQYEGDHYTAASSNHEVVLGHGTNVPTDERGEAVSEVGDKETIVAPKGNIATDMPFAPTTLTPTAVTADVSNASVSILLSSVEEPVQKKDEKDETANANENESGSGSGSGSGNGNRSGSESESEGETENEYKNENERKSERKKATGSMSERSTEKMHIIVANSPSNNLSIDKQKTKENPVTVVVPVNYVERERNSTFQYSGTTISVVSSGPESAIPSETVEKSSPMSTLRVQPPENPAVAVTGSPTSLEYHPSPSVLPSAKIPTLSLPRPAIVPPQVPHRSPMQQPRPHLPHPQPHPHPHPHPYPQPQPPHQRPGHGTIHFIGSMRPAVVFRPTGLPPSMPMSMSMSVPMPLLMPMSHISSPMAHMHPVPPPPPLSKTMPVHVAPHSSLLDQSTRSRLRPPVQPAAETISVAHTRLSPSPSSTSSLSIVATTLHESTSTLDNSLPPPPPPPPPPPALDRQASRLTEGNGLSSGGSSINGSNGLGGSVQQLTATNNPPYVASHSVMVEQAPLLQLLEVEKEEEGAGSKNQEKVEKELSEKGLTGVASVVDAAPSGSQHRTTTNLPSLTTDPIFSHYKQPAKPISGPMYLIIQGHSKVKTYKPTVNKYSTPLEKKEIAENLATTTTRKELSVFERYVREKENAGRTSGRTLEEKRKLEHKARAEILARSQGDNLMSLVERGLGSFSAVATSTLLPPFLSSTTEEPRVNTTMMTTTTTTTAPTTTRRRRRRRRRRTTVPTTAPTTGIEVDAD